MTRIRLLCCCFFCAWGWALLAQQPLRLHLEGDDAVPVLCGALRSINIQTFDFQENTLFFPKVDSVALLPLCRTLLQQLREESYLVASVDSLRQDAAGGTVGRLHLGPSMRWLRLRPARAADERWLSAAGFREQLFREKPLRHSTLLDLERAVLEQAENSGYPFAQVFLDSVRVGADGGVSALLRLEPNRFFVLNQVNLKGDLRLPRAFLPRYLGLRKGEPYSRAKFLRLREQLRTLLFVEPNGNPSVTFSGGEANINLFLQKKRASRFDFIIGLLPQPNTNDGRLLVTGSLSAAFQNALNLGERFLLEFERLRPETQKLDVQAGLPYVFGSAFGVEGRLNIFRRDSTWVDAQSDLGLQYLLPEGNFVKLLWENKRSSLQKIDTLALLRTRALPPNLDLRQNGFGLETGLTRLDYRFNPRSGWALSLKAVAGFNTVLRNSQIEALRPPGNSENFFAGLYDSLGERSTRFRVEARVEGFIPLFARSTLKLGFRGGGIFAQKPVFANEQYRLGGNKLLRGFDEESLFATRFGVATVEYRLLIGLNAFLAAFADYAYLENVTTQARSFLRPLGMGAGMNFETKAGIFGISLAVGRRDVGQGVDLRATKFHLGYVSLF